MCPEAPRPLLGSWGLDKAPPGNQAVRVLLTLSAQSLLSHAIRTSYLAAGGGHPGAPHLTVSTFMVMIKHTCRHELPWIKVRIRVPLGECGPGSRSELVPVPCRRGLI